METIEIQFRIFKNEVIAVFPYIIDGRNTVLSYAHIGQHSGCIWDINRITKPAKETEYQNLLTELKSIYFDCNLVVIKRRNHQKYLTLYHKYVEEHIS